MSNKKKRRFYPQIPFGDSIFSDITERDRTKAIEEIIESSSPRKSFFVMTTVAAIICTLGVAGGNTAVIVGAMLVTPMLSPILAIAMGVGMADFKLIYRSIRVVLLAAGYSLAFSFLVALLLKKPDVNNMNQEMLFGIGVSLEVFLIALVSGVAASLSSIRSELHQYMSGVAIAVALIPPISMAAIGLRMLNFEIFYQSLMQFGLSLCGIVLSSLVVFSLSKFYISKNKAEEELEQEEQLLGVSQQNQK